MVTRTYEVRTYGCQMNVRDSERIAGLLDEAGYAPVADGAQPDVVVFSTCAVRENADNKLDGNLGHLKPVKDRTPGMQIAVGLRRMFSSLAWMPLSEYVRRRRMTVAAAEVVTGIGDLLGIAVRYGYGSAEAFGRAFQSVHGVSPGQRIAKLIYSMITSLDGYAEAAEGDLGTGPRTRPRRTIVDRHRDLAMASRAVLPRYRHRRR